MGESKWVCGKRYVSGRGEEFELLEKRNRDKQTYYLVRFIETNNYQYVHTAVLNSASRMKDSSRPHVAGIGYATGTKDRPFSPKDDASAYEIWSAMINRCYLRGTGVKSYKDVEVVKEWHDFANFLTWFKSEVYSNSLVLGHSLALDKDLFGKGKRIYSAETCCFLPKSINSLLVNIDFGDLSRDVARNVYHLDISVLAHGEILSAKVRGHLRALIDDYAIRYYGLVGFTLEKVFKDDFKHKVDLSKVSINGILEYNERAYKFTNLKELKAFVETLETEEGAAKIAQICKHNIIRFGESKSMPSHR